MANTVFMYFTALLFAVGIAVSAQAADGVATTSDEENLQKIKDKERSTANKLLGAASIGSAGVGGMNAMVGLAEQQADQDAEEDMKAYLATFTCDYGNGRNIRGGERNIELPGGNDLMAMVSEYKMLAADLKVRKEALGKRLGIESEVILDAAETGLYSNVGTERQSGAYVSLSRALSDKNGADAAAWAQQKSDSVSKVKSGAVTAATGAAVGLLGNVLINSESAGLKNFLTGNTVAAGANDEYGYGVSGALGEAGNSVNAHNSGGGSNSGIGGFDSEIDRASNACDVLRSDISVRAESLYDDLLTVQSDAQSEEIDTTVIDSAVSSAGTAKEAIATAMAAADKALSAAQGLTIPELDESSCEEDAPEKPESPDRDEFECEEGVQACEEYDRAVAQYQRQLEKHQQALQKHEQKQNDCLQKDKTAYNKAVTTLIADAKKQANEAVRQMGIGRTELGKIEKALSNAQSAKTRGIDAKERAAAKESAEQKKAEELAQQISDKADQAKDYAARARNHYDDARDVVSRVNQAIVLDEAESAAQEQIDALKATVDEDIENTQSAMENAEKQVKAASDAGTLKEASDAVAEAARQESIARGRLQSIQVALQKIEDAKQIARQKYEQEQQEEQEEQEDSEESDEDVDIEED